MVIIHHTVPDAFSAKYSTAASEKEKLNSAVSSFTDEIKALVKTAGKQEAEILEGHLSMLADPVMQQQIYENIDGGAAAATAVDTVCTAYYRMLNTANDELLCQRAVDIKEIRDTLLCMLSGIQEPDITAFPKGAVLIMKELTPSAMCKINRESVAGIITEAGGVTSHGAIIARAKGIPAVLAVPNALDVIPDGARVILDGFRGNIIVHPTEDEIACYFEKQKEKQIVSAAMPSNKIKKVYGTVGSAEEVKNVLQNGGEGIGLFRTEFLFMNSACALTEEEQYREYADAVKTIGGREVIFRTLDIGGDKPLRYLSAEKAENPLLGTRGIRFSLERIPLFKTQIRAILRAAVFGNVQMMFPFITTVEEVKTARKIVEECAAELENEGVHFRRVPVGVMIETPSAALISDLLAEESDFFSIGTNDLIGYTMAVDRGSTKNLSLYNVMQPSVLRAIEMTIKNAKAKGIAIGICGEAAADERLLPRLIEWGIDTFSVTPSVINQVKKMLPDAK